MFVPSNFGEKVALSYGVCMALDVAGCYPSVILAVNVYRPESMAVETGLPVYRPVKRPVDGGNI